MTEVRFYHLTQTPLERVLPDLLQKSLSRGWRVLVQCGVAARMAQLDDHLWTMQDHSFIPHGIAGGQNDAQQPILLSADAAPINSANVLMLVDGAQIEPANLDSYETVALFFDGNDEAATIQARSDWKNVVAQGLTAVYWAQEQSGSWVKKATA